MGNLKEGTDCRLRTYPTAKFDSEEIARSLLVNRKYKEVLQAETCMKAYVDDFAFTMRTHQLIGIKNYIP